MDKLKSAIRITKDLMSNTMGIQAYQIEALAELLDLATQVLESGMPEKRTLEELKSKPCPYSKKIKCCTMQDWARNQAIDDCTLYLAKLQTEIEQLRVQLAGCGVAVLGYAKDKNDCKKGDYGWSQSFEDVKTLYAKLQKLQAQWREKVNVQKMSEVTADLVEKHFPKGKCQERGAALVLHAEMLIALHDYLGGD